MSNKTRANLVAKYILEVGAIKDRDVFEKELTGMPKHYRVYLRKYNKIVEKENRSIADKVKKQMKVENTYLDKHI
ncbi:MAG: hypothetical protein Q8O99_05135 [bacterium]|nr:hypothetical protein [bacterium]